MKSVLFETVVQQNKKKLVLFFIIALIISGSIASCLYFLARNYMINQAEEKIQDLLMRRKALHLYIQRNTHPALYRLKKEGEVKKDFYSPELLSSSFMARHIHDYYNEERKNAGLAELYYKFAAVNPRNPVNEGDAFERGLIQMFNTDSSIKEYRKTMVLDGKKHLYFARPFLLTNDACLKCHGEPETAPHQLRKIYGDLAGFFADPGEVRAIESIRAPLESEIKTANILFVALLSGVMVIIVLVYVSGRLQTVVTSRTVSLEREIRERRQTQAELAKQTELLTHILTTIPVGVFWKDTESVYLGCNETFAQATGMKTSEDIIGKTDYDLSLTRQEADFSRQYDKKVLASGTAVTDIEESMTQADGKQATVLTSKVPLHNPDGSIFCVLGVYYDITERKQAEEEKKKLETQLHRAEKMETIGTLAGGVAHDLNNILGAIVGYPDLLLDDIPLDSPLRSSILAIKQSGERAAMVVQDLLTLARRGVSITEVANLNSIIKRFLEAREYKKIQESYPAIVCETDLCIDLLNTICSPAQVSKVVINLVTNAVEATEGRGEITISTENRYLDTSIKGYDRVDEGDYAVLSVSDNGPGISREDLKRIFEPFYTKKVMGRSGTGLGLAVVWGTVKDHRGYIDVDTTEGGGTTFRLYFPATRKQIKSGEKPASVEQYRGHGEKILVVDDIEAQQEIAAALLKRLDYAVETVSSGEEAVAYVRHNTADLLILDMIMDPGIDGLETYKRIVSVKPNQKAVIASGFTETDRVKQAQKLGAGCYIKKPYTLEKIGQAVKTELERTA